MTSPDDLFAELVRARTADDVQAVDTVTHAIVVAYLPLVRRVASTLPSKLPFEDRVQEGTLALYAALAAYDPARGAFAAYAMPGIRGAMMRGALRDTAVPVPDRRQLTSTVSIDAPLGDEPGGTMHDVLAEDADRHDVLDAYALHEALEKLSRRERMMVARFMRAGDPLPEKLVRKLRRLLA